MTGTIQVRASELSRRSFLITAGGLGIAVAFGGLPGMLWAPPLRRRPKATIARMPG